MGDSEIKKPPAKKDDSLSDLATALVIVAISQAVAYPLGLSVIAALAMGINVLVWIPSILMKNEMFYDLAGMCGLIASSLYSQFNYMVTNLVGIGDVAPGGGFPRRAIATGLVLLWTLRLEAFLFRRICRNRSEPRFKNVIDQPFQFLVCFAMQGLWVFVTLLPLFALHTIDPEDSPRDFGFRETLGLILWFFGFVLEVVADEQKLAFKVDPANSGKFVDVGLWSRCRHPNYLGEMLIWIGFFIFCSPGLLEDNGWITLMGPASVICVVGLVGTSAREKMADKKFGNSPDYAKYKKRTPCLGIRLW